MTLSETARRQWRSFVKSANPQAAFVNQPSPYSPESSPFGVPIDWDGLFEFIIGLHERRESVDPEEIEQLMRSVSVSPGAAEDVAFFYDLARRLLTAYDRHRDGDGNG